MNIQTVPIKEKAMHHMFHHWKLWISLTMDAQQNSSVFDTC